MKLVLSALALVAVLPAVSEAKITLYSNADAVRKVMASSSFKRSQLSLDSIQVSQVKGGSAYQTFTVYVTSSGASPVGPRPCTATYVVEVVKDTSAPAGITASKMNAAELVDTVCAP